MDGGVTRSLYIGRDKTLEVLKRREAAEKELQAKREAKIREQYEKMQRAAQLKEAEMRDRARQKHQRELERQKAVLDRRCAQMEQIKAKKTELLKRAHHGSSRIAALNQAKKPVYAFGSSTPRKLAFMENIQIQQRDSGASRNSSMGMRASTPSLAQGSSNTAPTTSRFQNPLSLDGKMGPTAMTRSVVVGTSGISIGATPNKKNNPNKPPAHNQPPKQTPNAIKKQRKIANEGILSNATMTQSLYAQGTSRVKTAHANVQKAPVIKQTPKKNLPTSAKSIPIPNVLTNANSVSVNQMAKPVVAQRPPPIIHPKKQMQNHTGPAKEEGSDEASANAEDAAVIPEQLKQEEETYVVYDHAQVKEKEEGALILANISQSEAQLTFVVDPPEREEKITDIVDETMSRKENEALGNTGNLTLVSEGQPDKITTQSLFEELVGPNLPQETSGQYVENDLQQEKQNSPTLTATNTSFYTAHESSSIGEVSMYEHVPLPENEPIITPPKSPAPPVNIVIQNPEEERRRHIKEILARTRQEVNAPPNTPNSNNVAPNIISGGAFSSTIPSVPISASNPFLPQKDASALVQDINAKYLHKFKKQQQKDDETAKTSPTNDEDGQSKNLSNELAGSGFSAENNAGKGNFCLPGQVISASNQFSHATSLTIFSKKVEESDDHFTLKQHPSPPDDPLISGYEINGKEFHPPEPTTNGQSS